MKFEFENFEHLHSNTRVNTKLRKLAATKKSCSGWAASKITAKSLVLGGWGGCKSRFKDGLQQSKS